ncbi:SET domain-containing protein [Heliocybe sulcata]|uniref:SET domain-containing protein n=1 Tax=Heliocybe sulcata TaxID=5364 RepID=A0A5C3MRG6_9AGAM|nr:SET domain-containing protein [Heliocybe sulcata]
MSSFAGLRAAKASKQHTRSFVKPPTDAPPDDSPGSKPDASLEAYDGLPPSLSIRRSPDRGRGVYATQPLTRGATVVTVPPHVHALSTSRLSEYCSSCAAQRAELKRCTRCKLVWYCNASCQNNDWALHKHECPALIRWAADDPVPSDAVRCLGRMLWAIAANGLQSLFTRQLASMQSSRPVAQAPTHTHLAHALVRFMGISGPEQLLKYGVQGAGGVADVIARFTTNAITLSSPTLTPLGVLLSPLAALFNHSCDPSAVIVFPSFHSSADLKLRVICMRDIEPGEEIFTSYIDITLPTPLRQQSLLETYDFRCSCSLCTTQGVDPREAVMCPRNGCGGIWRVPPESDANSSNEVKTEEILECTNQHPIPPSTVTEVQDAVRVGSEGLKEAERVQDSDPTRAHRLTSNLTAHLTALSLPPSTHPLLALLRLHAHLSLPSLTSTLSSLPSLGRNMP